MQQIDKIILYLWVKWRRYVSPLHLEILEWQNSPIINNWWKGAEGQWRITCNSMRKTSQPQAAREKGWRWLGEKRRVLSSVKLLSNKVLDHKRLVERVGWEPTHTSICKTRWTKFKNYKERVKKERGESMSECDKLAFSFTFLHFQPADCTESSKCFC